MSTAPGAPDPKPLAWLHGEIKTPPFSRQARVEVGTLLRLLQRGEALAMPHSRPMPSLGANCHELRVRDANRDWRILYRIDDDAILIGEVFSKTTRSTPKSVIETCKDRFRRYDLAVREAARSRARPKRGGR